MERIQYTRHRKENYLFVVNAEPTVLNQGSLPIHVFIVTRSTRWVALLLAPGETLLIPQLHYRCQG